MAKSLNLYARVEDLLGVSDVAPILYSYYFKTLEKLEFSSLLDIGCGRGEFLAKLQQLYPDRDFIGIDLSSVMVEIAKKKGVKAYCTNISNLQGKFDIITAVFDMVNYLNPKELKPFLKSVEEHLVNGGYFICDINSYYAFSDLAVGAYVRDDDSRFVTVDSFFEDDIYYSEFTLFEKLKDNIFEKFKENILQYYYDIEDLTNSTSLKLIDKRGISVYGDEVEKHYLVFRK
jgi:cyclopropane fatty-acyl-phospholipid synthase-like methyltransferase